MVPDPAGTGPMREPGRGPGMLAFELARDSSRTMGRGSGGDRQQRDDGGRGETLHRATIS